MRLCLMIEGQEDVSWEQWLALADVCERSGLEGLFRSDHYLSVFGHEERASLDAWATLAALAARTERIRLGTLVSPVTFRHPSVLAKTVVTVDHVSGGRVELGLGAGWNEQEHAAFAFPFPDVATRMDLLEKQLEVVTRQWAEGNPSPVQKPRPPLILGGHAGRRSVDLAVRFADEYNVIFVTSQECREVRGRLDAACKQAGCEPLRLSLMTACIVATDETELLDRVRQWLDVTGDDADPESYLRERTSGQLVGTAGQVVEQLRAYEEAGVERVFLQHLVHHDLETVELLGAEVAPAVA